MDIVYPIKRLNLDRPRVEKYIMLHMIREGYYAKAFLLPSDDLDVLYGSLY